jgi:uncharacterized protein (TIGR02246 family)
MRHQQERTGPAISPSDQAAINDLLRRMGDAWAKGDGDAYGAVFAEDAHYVNAPGERVVRRRAIAASHQRSSTHSFVTPAWVAGTPSTCRC